VVPNVSDSGPDRGPVKDNTETAGHRDPAGSEFRGPKPGARSPIPDTRNPRKTLAQIGKVIKVAGPAVDVQYEEGHLPKIYNAVRITSEGFDVPDPIDIICEVQQHLGEGRVRTIAMQPTDGLVRGMKAADQGGPISVPVGPQTLGRILNVLGEPVDKKGPVETEKRMPIHRSAPTLEEQSTELEMFETGIKVIDLLEPYLRGGKIGLFGGPLLSQVPLRDLNSLVRLLSFD
jgi:F0F1-type ATP synthase beta subunit